MAPSVTSSSSSVQAWPERGSKPQQWWGEQHTLPTPGNVDRLRLFVQPQNMEKEEQKRILKNWQAMAGDPEDEMTLGMSHQLRPSTPRAERVEKQVRRLEEDQGKPVPDAARAKMKAHYVANSGWLESLRHYCQGEAHLSMEYVNELIKMTDMLMLESAKQLDIQARAHRVAVEDLEMKFQDKLHDKTHDETHDEPQFEPHVEPSNRESLEEQLEHERGLWKLAEGHMQATISDLLKRLDAAKNEVKDTKQQVTQTKNQLAETKKQLKEAEKRESSQESSPQSSGGSGRTGISAKLRKVFRGKPSSEDS